MVQVGGKDRYLDEAKSYLSQLLSRLRTIGVRDVKVEIIDDGMHFNVLGEMSRVE